MRNSTHRVDPIPFVRPGDRGIERQLSDFFQSEIPQPWPRAPVVDSEKADVPRSTLPFGQNCRRYLALAAAIALFVGGSWTISALFPSFQKDLNQLNSEGRIGASPVLPDGNSPSQPAPLEDVNKAFKGVPANNFRDANGTQYEERINRSDDGTIDMLFRKSPNKGIRLP